LIIIYYGNTIQGEKEMTTLRQLGILLNTLEKEGKLEWATATNWIGDQRGVIIRFPKEKKT